MPVVQTPGSASRKRTRRFGLHDWDLNRKQILLERASAALPAGAALIVYETLIDDERKENALGLLMSLNMVIETPGGFEYPKADCFGGTRHAGFRQTRAEHLIGRSRW